ncbi:hypothetical protein D9M68_896930 [compost metagenome]
MPGDVVLNLVNLAGQNSVACQGQLTGRALLELFGQAHALAGEQLQLECVGRSEQVAFDRPAVPGFVGLAADAQADVSARRH